MKDQEDPDIDYMHPEGKPAKKTEPLEEKKFDGRELEAAARREKNALIRCRWTSHLFFRMPEKAQGETLD